MDPFIVSLFGDIKSYLQCKRAPGPNTISQSVQQLNQRGYQDEAIACFNMVKNQLTLDEYYDLKHHFRYLEYEFNYDFFRKD